MSANPAPTLITTPDGKPFELPKGTTAQTVTSVEHFSPDLFCFRIERPESFRFRSGEFVMIGLPNAEKPVFRAYSIASANWADHIEFFSIKVPDGPLTEHLQKIKPGDKVLIKGRSVGTLVLDALKPGRNLYLLSTGTGFAPFGSVIQDPDTYERFRRVVAVQTCRTVAELGYIQSLRERLEADEDISGFIDGRLTWLTSATREPWPCQARVTDLLRSGELFDLSGREPFDPELDRAMICGSMAMLKETRDICESMGLIEGSNSRPGTFVVERAFVD